MARRLWTTVNRDNLYVKVPATGGGLAAITGVLGQGISVNVTLMPWMGNAPSWTPTSAAWNRLTPLVLQSDHQGTQGQRVRENGDTRDTQYPPVSLPTDPVFTGQDNFGDIGDGSHPVGVAAAVKA
jgi:hypothetical protein